MSLRVRLIVAFFLLSVVPLAAVTYYTYATNLEAVRAAAGAEAELLAGELSQRMQVVTAQLSQRVERLMNLSTQATAAGSAETAASMPAATAAATSSVPAGGAASGGATAPAGSPTMAAQDVRNALGDLAMLINNVEIRGARRGGRGGPGGPGGPGGRGGFGVRGGPPPPGAPVPSTPPSASGTPGAVSPAAPGAPAGAPAGAGTTPSTSSGASVSNDPFAGRGGDPSRGFDNNRLRGDRQGPPQDGGRGGRPGAGGPQDFGRGGPPPGPPPADDDPTRIRIDMAPVWREVLQQFVPDGNLESLSPEERQRVFAEVNQRMLGIQQGIQMLQERVAERVATAQAQNEAAASTATVAPSSTGAAASPAVPVAPVAPVAPPAPQPAAAPSPAAPAAAAAIPRRTTAISGGQLAVSVEQDGEVLSQASAEINLPNLLATVFTTTRRERGEVPFAVAKDGALHTPTDADRQTIASIGSSALSPTTPAETIVTRDWIITTTPDPTGLEAKFGIARPLGDAVADVQRKTALNAGFGLGLVILALVGIVPISSRLTRNLESLSDGVNRISQGDYSARVAVKTNDEVGRLARAFNQMASDVEAHQRSVVGQERLRRELELGRQIQHDMLPQAPLKLGLTEIKGVSVPAREVGGDFFNYFQLGDGTVALLVGDVSGKGVGAALLMANIQASLRTRLSLGQDLAALARELDRDIENSTPGPVYATLLVGIFDPATRLLRCVNAGHNPQYVIRRDGRLERMESTGLPIGLIAGHGYTEQRFQLNAGDRLFFYTDGCVESENASAEMFGMERLEAALTHSAASDDVLAAVETEITRFRGGIELSDDATMMVVKVG